MIHLLDVNVLVALLWPAHQHHDKAQHWFARNAKAGWATCPFTQAAVIRILSNPAFSPDALTVEEAINVLSASLEHPTHHFWTDDISFIQAAKPFRNRLVGHQQVTDTYLLGLAMCRKARFVTMDRAVLAILPELDGVSSPVVVI